MPATAPHQRPRPMRPCYSPPKATTHQALDTLQQQLGPAVRVLRVDEATHPAVVRSFDGRGLGAYAARRRALAPAGHPSEPGRYTPHYEPADLSSTDF